MCSTEGDKYHCGDARAHVRVCIRVVARESRNVAALYRLSMACLLSTIGFTYDIPAIYICAREDDNGRLRIPVAAACKFCDSIHRISIR